MQFQHIFFSLSLLTPTSQSSNGSRFGLSRNSVNSLKHTLYRAFHNTFWPIFLLSFAIYSSEHSYLTNPMNPKTISKIYDVFSRVHTIVYFLCQLQLRHDRHRHNLNGPPPGHRNQEPRHRVLPSDTLERISFIGHSLGGVIIRAALPKLLDYRNKFHTFITFSSPHIGYKVNASSVIQAGIWVLQKFKNSLCLKQLTMSDTADPR